MDAREQLIREIELIEQELQAKREALELLTKAAGMRGDSSLRFYGQAPIKAIRTLIQEAGRPMTRQELHDTLTAGGNSMGKKGGGNTITNSIDLNLKLENLVAKGDLIDLPRGKGDE